MCAGRRKVLNGGRRTGAVSKHVVARMQRRVERGLAKLKPGKENFLRPTERKFSEDMPFIAVRFDGRKRRVVSGPARMAKMRSNKGYKSGD